MEFDDMAKLFWSPMGALLPTRSRDEDAVCLSRREGEILQLAAQGLTDQAIAKWLGISLATVSTYWGRVRIKLGPFNRTELVAKYLGGKAEDAIERLRIENQVLLEKIAEHARVEEMLRASLEMFRGLLETAPDAILVLDGEGRLQFANEQASRLFGYSTDELLRLNVEDLVPERYRSVPLGRRQEFGLLPAGRKSAAYPAPLARRKDGTEFPTATALSSTRTPNGVITTCIVRDLSKSASETFEVVR